MNTVRGGRAALLGLLGLCVAVVVGLLLVQGGGAATPTPPTTSSTAEDSAATGALPSASAREPEAAHTPVSGLSTVAESELPAEAHETLGLIRGGGPFPYGQDDETFFNREGILPDRPTGYYREYTVETRGSPDRGARRIVAGDDGDLYYTSDHYDSFEQIEEGR